MSSEWKTDRVGAALRDENPTVLRCMATAFAVIGDLQLLPGYCVFDHRHSWRRLADRSTRLQFPADMEALGEAVQDVCEQRDAQFRRINLEIHGNHDSFLHAHIWRVTSGKVRTMFGVRTRCTRWTTDRLCA